MKIVGGKWSNWSSAVVCKPRQVIVPRDEVELAGAIRSAEGPVRVPGTGHSFTPLCASDGMMVDMAAFSGLKRTDSVASTATLFAATPLWAAGPALHAKGVGLLNMGDIDRQTLGGVVGTGTHGTGRTLVSISSAVDGFRIILADGSVLNCSATENQEIFAAGRVSMGMLGVMTEITMRVRPAYRLMERNFLLPPDELFAKLDALVADNRHFEFFWFPYADVAVCKTLNETERTGARAAFRGRNARARRTDGLGYSNIRVHQSRAALRAVSARAGASAFFTVHARPRHGPAGATRFFPARGRSGSTKWNTRFHTNVGRIACARSSIRSARSASTPASARVPERCAGRYLAQPLL